MFSNLTEEQRQRIEEKRQRALQIRRQKIAQQKCQVHPTTSMQPASATTRSIQPKANTGATHQQGSAPIRPRNPSERPAQTKAVCELRTRDRFDIQIGYQQDIIDAFKKIRSALFDGETKRWHFHLTDYTTVISTLRKLSNLMHIDELPSAVKLVFNRPIKNGVSMQPRTSPARDVVRTRLLAAGLSATFCDTMYEFQAEGVYFALQQNGRALIADEMGLGKTVQAIAVALCYKSAWPVVVVCPAGLRCNWENSWRRWVPTLRDTQIDIVDGQRWTPGRAGSRDVIYILSYEMLSKHIGTLIGLKPGVVILDESHYIKSYKAKRTLHAHQLCAAAKNCLLLSGTPALSRPQELYSQIQALRPRLFRNFMEFARRYCDAKETRFGWDYNGSSHTTELRLLLEETLMIRRLKAEVLEQLPAKVRSMIVLDKASVRTNLQELQDAADKVRVAAGGMEQRNALLSLFAETGRAKMEAVAAYVLDLLSHAGANKILVFAHHKELMDYVSQELEKAKHEHIRIDGSVSADNRSYRVEQFQTREEVKAALLSITAANTGLTLTAATLVVFAELYWNPGTMAQAEDRAHRVGQRNCVHVQYLVARGTADDHLWPMVQTKLGVLNSLALSKDNFAHASTTVIHDDHANVSETGRQGDATQQTMENFFEVLSESMTVEQEEAENDDDDDAVLLQLLENSSSRRVDDSVGQNGTYSGEQSTVNPLIARTTVSSTRQTSSSSSTTHVGLNEEEALGALCASSSSSQPSQVSTTSSGTPKQRFTADELFPGRDDELDSDIEEVADEGDRCCSPLTELLGGDEAPLQPTQAKRARRCKAAG